MTISTAASAEEQTQGKSDSAENKGAWAIALHGGAGGKLSERTERDIAKEQTMERALRKGKAILEKGGTSLDAVEQVVRVMEDDPLFNAGLGAVLNSDGAHELDASIMDGRTRACGSVSSATIVKNPISLARLVMTNTRHIILGADGADRFAKEMGVELVENRYFRTEPRYQEWLRAKKEFEKQQRDKSKSKQTSENNRPFLDTPEQTYFGTVGCVALDQHGNLAAATSTGGLVNKMFGRIGDTPIVCASTYADNESCAVSTTGIGEDFIRNSGAYDVSARMRYQKLPLAEAIKSVIHSKTRPIRGAIIGVNRNGDLAMHFSSKKMAFAMADSSGRFEVLIALDQKKDSRE